MAAIRPATFYEWLLLIKRHKLRLGPLEGIGVALVHHALGRVDRASYGFWDHQSCSGYLDPDKHAEIEVKPAPAVDARDREWE